MFIERSRCIVTSVNLRVVVFASNNSYGMGTSAVQLDSVTRAWKTTPAPTTAEPPFVHGPGWQEVSDGRRMATVFDVMGDGRRGRTLQSLARFQTSLRSVRKIILNSARATLLVFLHRTCEE